jgi:hypothetical protein
LDAVGERFRPDLAASAETSVSRAGSLALPNLS